MAGAQVVGRGDGLHYWVYLRTRRGQPARGFAMAMGVDCVT